MIVMIVIALWVFFVSGLTGKCQAIVMTIVVTIKEAIVMTIAWQAKGEKGPKRNDNRDNHDNPSSPIMTMP
jgi:hypothetical protein